MKYTVIITKEKDGDVHATVPGVPDCHVRAKTRHEVIRAIRESFADFISQSEIIQLELAAGPKSESIHQDTPWKFFGVFERDSMWGEVFDDIERRRNADGDI